MSLKKTVLNGFIWSSIGTLGNGLVSFLVTIILARILTPSDFALIALLTVFISVSNVIVDSGFSQAIIRDDNPSDVDLSSIFIFNMIISTILYSILFILAPYISLFYQTPDLELLSKIVFLVIIFNALIVIQNALLKRELNFVLVEKISVLGSFFAGVVSVIMAFTGFGVWALVANMVLMPFCRGILLWKYSKWRPKIIFSFKSLKRYLSFGIFLMFQGLIDVFVTNLNTLFIGKIYTKNDLGYYSQGGKLDSYIVTPLNAVIDKVVYPIFSRIKNDDLQLKDGYRKMLGMLLCIILPTMFFVSLYAENIVVVLFGKQWIEAGNYLQLISILGLFQLIHKVSISFIMIKGKTNTMFFIALIKQSLRVVALFLTINISVYSMVLGFVISGIIGSLLYIYLSMHYVQCSFFEIMHDNFKTLFSTFFSIIILIALVDFTQHDIESINLIFQGLLYFCIYMSLNFLLKNKYILNIVGLLR